MQRADLEREFGVSPKIAKRDLEALVSAGRIEFIRSLQPGAYRGR